MATGQGLSTRRSKTRSYRKTDIPGEMKSLYTSSVTKLQELRDYLDGFNDLAKRAEVDSGEFYCPKCKKSRESPDGATNLFMYHNENDLKEIESLKEENEKMKKEYNVRENEDLRRQLEKVRKECDASKQEVQSLRSKVARLEDEKCKLQRQYTDWQKTELLLGKEIKDLQHSKDSVKAELMHCKQEIQLKVAQLDDKKSRSQRQHTDWQRTETQLRKEIKDLQQSKDAIKVELMRHKQENARQQDQIRKLNQEIQLLRQRPRKRVSLYTHTTLNPTLADHALRELMTKLRERLQTEKVELEERLYDSRHDVTDPVVAICINVSRLGTDVQEVVKNVKTAQQDIVVLVLHHKETHALPNQSSDRILTGAEYKKLGAIIDVAFLSNKGMYPCELNTFAIERLVSFLLQYKKDT